MPEPQASGVSAASPRTWRRFATPEVALLVVAVVYALSTVPGALLLRSLLWDEVVYASQLAHGVHPVVWSAPRAWGMPLLLAPVDLFTTSTIVIRLYLSGLAGVGLFLAFRPWLRVVDPWVVPVAAGLFATLWTSVLYGALAYPNLWLAFAVVAGVGYICRELQDQSSRGSLVGILVTFAIASLLRPTDASILAAPVLLVCLGRRAWPLVAATAAGLAVGWLVWTGEAFLRFGGLFARLSSSSRINDIHPGFYPLPMLDAVDGPRLLCRPAELCQDTHLLGVAWWLLLPILAVIGIAAARQRLPFLLVTGSAAFLALSYVLTIDWASPRFLIPSYALLSLPVAGALIAMIRWRRGMAVVIALALVLHVATQVRSYAGVLRPEVGSTAVFAAQADELRDAFGLRAPCVILGPRAIQLSFLTGCEADYSAKAPSPQDPAAVEAIASGKQAFIVLPSGPDAPPPADGWQLGRLRAGRGSSVYISTP